MKCVLTGSHGTGKTTIINSIYDWLEEKNIKPIINSSSARKIKQSGRLINDDGDDIVQMIVNSSHIVNFREDNWFADRCIIDSFSYAVYQYKIGKVSKEVYEISYYMVKQFAGLYDKIFYVPIEFHLTKDGERKDELNFQREIDTIISNTISDLKLSVVRITGSVEERVELIKNHIK
jgi:predicted ATPase